MTIGFVFTRAPFGDTQGREGLDALLAASNYTDNIAVFFIFDGVMQLLAGQDPTTLLCRDHIKSFKLLPLYDVEQIYICQDSLALRGLAEVDLALDAQSLPQAKMAAKMAACRQLVRF